MLLPVIYLTYSLFAGKPAGDNPWVLPGLEWRTTSPPPTFNFDETPVVTWEAYEFGEESGLFEEHETEVKPVSLFEEEGK